MVMAGNRERGMGEGEGRVGEGGFLEIVWGGLGGGGMG